MMSPDPHPPAPPGPARLSRRRFARPVVGLGLLVGVAAAGGTVFGLYGGESEAQAPSAPPPAPTVTAVSLTPQSVPIHTTLPGRTSAFQTAEIRPQVSGVLRERLFQEGQQVKAGQPLYRIDPAPYQAALASAQAALAKSQATLESASVTATRYKPLVAQNAVSRLDYETAVATQKSAEADVASARAAVDTARINLGYTTVTSPISGRTSRSSVTVGALLTSDQTSALMTVTQLDPIYVDVVQPASTLLRLRRELASGQLKRDADNNPEVTLQLGDGSEYAQKGTLQFSEVIVSTDTNTVTLRAQFPNPDGTLLPGMFVRASLEEGSLQNGLLVPQQGVTHDVRGNATALVVGKDGTVATRTLTVVEAIGNKWLVSGGFQDGDRVIVEGTQKVTNGAKPQLRALTADQFDAQVAAEAKAATTSQRS
ncbi:efflux RND transporter periplasmic adaptor subunit [Roseomonas elaeocarpi]|uniref:Efflux RND transporter periplasmic adaptor subunit n=1 Tax=Roseomonas elaeocarpi TaxID=907779 RepID=A0ABV6JRS0_9PROT